MTSDNKGANTLPNYLSYLSEKHRNHIIKLINKYPSLFNSFPAIDEYSNPCSRCVTVRKALARVLNELRDFRVRNSKMIGITQKKNVDHITY